jgi:small redox-active disulfide protein 2
MENKPISIQVLGVGCPTCKRLYDLVTEAVNEIKLDTKVEYITDVKKIIEMGISQSPILALDGNPIIVGFVPSKEEIKEAITNYIAAAQGKPGFVQKSGGCSCGGNC